ncbi:TonB-dependent receptor [Mariniflexile litorale]|uniref:TonB-dependent receptor n=1 Tax=Mariniflexile litorale TaxID=3045158 RepID=A0AAU7EGX9_9FLAO|nr:TonB-dependent receptor [Mariniflexile sp. KMM 9835]MDQ8210848.1 TonB-dependent receptor [Mariniflexile sp. KMM 9835]
MKNKSTIVLSLFRRQLLLAIMKTLIFLLCTTVFSLSAGNSFSQEKVVIESNKSMSVNQVFKIIKHQTNYRFIYPKDLFKDSPEVYVKKGEILASKLLEQVLSSKDLNFELTENNTIVIKEKPSQIDDTKKQGFQINGTVFDANNQPLPGANIIEKGTNNGTQTDFNGDFALKVSNANATLVFSYLGFVTQETAINSRTTITVNLLEDAASLDEVIVVGYGTMRKSDLTGAITQIKGDVFNTVSSSNPIEALQGKASGVSVINNDASPGATPTIRIRGSGSISAGNEPLIVVDGFPLINNNLNDINSNDIESMEILKDASSAAIYGSRGANGVILITTKKGKSGQNNLEVLGSTGFATPARLPKMLGRTDFINFINDAYTYSNGNPVYSASNPAPNYNVNWQDEIIQNVEQTQNYSVAFSGGNDKTTYMLSGNIFSQGGMVEASGFKKLTVRANLNHEYKPWLTVGTHLQTGRSQRDVRNDPTGDIFRYGWPTIPVKNDDGSWHYATEDPNISSYFEGPWNPVSNALEVTDELKSDRVLGDIYAIFTPVKNVTFKTNFGVDISNEKQYVYNTSESVSGINSGSTGNGGQTYMRKTSQLTDNILTYSNTWNDKHRLTATGVYSWQDYIYEDLKVSGSGFQNDATGANDISYASRESLSAESDKYSNKLISWTARASYSYADKYLLTATGRYDGSSRFGENNKWGFFPSIGFGWTIDKEPFMQNNDIISALKLRTSYGVTGNQEIGNYKSLSSLSTAYYVYDGVPILGFVETIGNPDLKWERNIQYNVGLDVSLWNRLDLNLDYYTRRTSDLLYNVPIPTSSGYSSMLQNIGEVKNVGLELTAHVRILDSDFKWDVTANISKNKNEIVELYGDVDRINLGSSSAGLASYLVVGEPVNSVWARESAGIIRTQDQLTAYQEIRSSAKLGEEMYVDHTPDKTINSDDYINIGATTPDLFYGISTSVSYKKLSLDIYGQGANGIASANGLPDNAESYLIFGESQIQNRNYMPTQYAYDRMWSPTNTSGTFPRAGAQEVYLSDRTNGDWNYFIVKNIKLGYDFSSIITHVDWIKELNIYVNAQNYINTANHRGYNPENGNSNFPYSKAIILGFSAKF